MIGPRWRKAARDLVARPGRSALAVIAMATGGFALTAIFVKYEMMRPVLSTMYQDTRPSSATLTLDRVDDDVVTLARAVPGVADAEARPVIVARARVGEDEFVPAILFVVRDFDRQRLDRFTHDGGTWPPGDDEVVLERAAVPVARTGPGTTLVLRVAGGDERSLPLVGTVHAPGLAPAWMEHVVYGFVPWTSLLRTATGRGGGESAQLRIVTDHPLDEGDIRDVVARVQTTLEATGRTVTRVDVPTPGRHPHADQMETFLYLVGAFGLLGFLLGAMLVASMVHAFLVEQIRQVGMMKAIGATTRQIAGIYLAQVGALAVLALAIGVPLGWLVGRAYARFSAGILNANLDHAPFPATAVGAAFVAGLAVPLLVALLPLRRAARIEVREALGGDVAGVAPFGARGFQRRLAAVLPLPRPWLVALRTTLLRPGRLALTVLTLALGGAVFMSALNVSAAWTRSVDDDFRSRRFDLSVHLAEPYAIARFADSLAALPGVAHAEYWPGALPYLVGASGGPVALVGPDPASGLLDLPLAAGRWLEPGDSAAAVVNNTVLTRRPDLGVGKTVELRLAGKIHPFLIVGVVEEMSPAPVIYAPRRAVLAATGQSADHARAIRVVTREHTAAAQLAASQEIERMFDRMGIEVRLIQSMLEVRRGILDHLVIVKAILTMAAVIVVFVGGLALTSMLTLGVLQRIREIGILSAIGAGSRVIAGQVWAEGVVIGVASWGVAVVLAAPVTLLLETVTGRMFFKIPLDFFMSPSAAAIWLGLVLLLASASSVYPAWRATRLTVREALSHE